MIPEPLQAPASLGAAPKEAQVFPSRELQRPWGEEVCEVEMMLNPQRVWDSWSQLCSPAHSFPWLCSAGWTSVQVGWCWIGLMDRDVGSPGLSSGRVFL